LRPTTTARKEGGEKTKEIRKGGRGKVENPDIRQKKKN